MKKEFDEMEKELIDKTDFELSGIQCEQIEKVFTILKQ